MLIETFAAMYYVFHEFSFRYVSTIPLTLLLPFISPFLQVLSQIFQNNLYFYVFSAS